MILACLGFALACVLAWSLLGSVERSFTAGCVLAQPGERHAIIAETSGNVVDVLVDVGDEVEVGQSIARIHVPELNQRANLARAKVAALESTSGIAADDLALAQAELKEIETLLASNEFIISPVAGEIAANRLAQGESVAPGSSVAMVLARSDTGLEAVSLLTPTQAEHLDLGAEAQVLIADDGGNRTQAMEAEVTATTDRAIAPPDWLAEYGLPVPSRGHLVQLAFDEPQGEHLTDGDPCNLRVVVGEHRPLAFLTPRGLR